MPREEQFDDHENDVPTNDEEVILQGWDRFLTRGKHSGPWGVFSLGHVNVVKGHIGKDIPWMDEHVVRIRAGMLHILSWVAILNVFFKRDPNIAWSV